MSIGSTPETELSLAAERFGDCRLVRAGGRVDFTNAARFREALQAEANGVGAGGGLVVDVSGLDLITSAGLRALMQTKQHLSGNGGQLVVAGAAGTVAEVIRIARFDTLLTMAPSARDGLQLISPNAAARYTG